MGAVRDWRQVSRLTRQWSGRSVMARADEMFAFTFELDQRSAHP